MFGTDVFKMPILNFSTYDSHALIRPITPSHVVDLKAAMDSVRFEEDVRRQLFLYLWNWIVSSPHLLFRCMF